MDTQINQFDSAIIEKMGGTIAVAKLFGIRPPSVSEWKSRGIPEARRMYLKLLRPDLFEGEQKPAAKEAA